MLEQVAGRAGRTGERGDVMIQTFDVNHPLYEYLRQHDYKGVYGQQLEEREIFKFPPFTRMIMITLRHRDMNRVEKTAHALMIGLRTIFGERVSSVIVPQVSRRNNQYVRQLRLRVEASANVMRAKQLLHQCMDVTLHQSAYKGTMISIDVDP